MHAERVTDKRTIQALKDLARACEAQIVHNDRRRARPRLRRDSSS
jgi:hypothetical protein